MYANFFKAVRSNFLRKFVKMILYTIVCLLGSIKSAKSAYC